MTRQAIAFLSVVAMAVPAASVPLLATPAAATSGPCTSPTIIGTGEPDELVGTEGPDVIDGLGGDDVITGLGGDDVLCGGSGADQLDGGQGDDRLHGQTDGLHGDTLTGGSGDDLLDPGDDARGDGPDDTLYFLDSLTGVVVDLPAGTVTGEGDDQVVGEVHQVVGSHHDDVLVGTAADEWLSGSGGSDLIDGGAGDDDLSDYGGDPADWPTDFGTNVFIGGPGDDVLRGADGDDDLRGGPGDDSLRDDGGLDQVRGGPGRDTCSTSMSEAEGEVVAGGTGRDLLELWFRHGHTLLRVDAVVRMDLAAGTASGRSGTTVVRVRVPGFESVTALPGTRWFVRGTAGPNHFAAFGRTSLVAHGLAGKDTFRGSTRHDAFDGGSGHDVAFRSGGRDRYVSVERIAGPSGRP